MGGAVLIAVQIRLLVFTLQASGVSVGGKLQKLRTQEGRCREFLVSILVAPSQNEAHRW